MRLILPLLAVSVSLAFAAPANATIVPGKGMAGVRLGMKEAQVRAVLGSPDSVTRKMDDFGEVMTMKYRTRKLHVRLRLGASGAFEAMWISTAGGRERTKEGVGVGSSERTLRRRLSGEKCETVGGTFRHCFLGRFLPGRIVTDFRISNGRVGSVVVARVID